MSVERRVVTIDGPSGAGKSTLARMLARRLGFRYLDTGAMYRAVALLAQMEGPDISDGGLQRILDEFSIRFVTGEGGGERTIVVDRDVTDDIRRPDITARSSELSGDLRVRKRMTELQREFGKRESLVAEGRDMGTVVFPDARAKFFLVADEKERARRRCLELRGAGERLSESEVLDQLQQRDQRDRSREAAPLRPAPDAVIVDSTHRTQESVLAEVLRILKNKIPELEF